MLRGMKKMHVDHVMVMDGVLVCAKKQAFLMVASRSCLDVSGVNRIESLVAIPPQCVLIFGEVISIACWERLYI